MLTNAELVAVLQKLVDEHGGDNVVAALYDTTWGIEYSDKFIEALAGLASPDGSGRIAKLQRTVSFGQIKVSSQKIADLLADVPE